jgi:hypothetical protein
MTMAMRSLPDRFEFTPDQLRLLQSRPGQPLHVSVDANNKVYLVIEEGLIPTLDDEYIRQGLSHAALQAENGQEREWSADEIKLVGRKLLARRGQQS